MDQKIDNIEGNGFIQNIYHYFWLRDPVLDVVPIISVPDTVLFKENQPYAWYFEMNNQTKRKMKENISLANIEKSFLRKCKDQEIIAMWVTKKIIQKQQQIVVEYLDKDQFSNYLNQNISVTWCIRLLEKGVYKDSFLQKETITVISFFLLIKVIIKAHWSPRMCFVERNYNLDSFKDKKKDIYKRVITFETDKVITQNVPIRGQILNNIVEKIINNVVQHIQNVTEKKIMDENKRLWFLFCSQLTFESSEPKIIQDNQVNFQYSLPHYLDNSENTKYEGHIREQDICLGGCGKKMSPNQLYQIQFGIIIKSWDYKLQILNHKVQMIENEQEEYGSDDSDDKQNYISQQNKLKLYNHQVIPTTIGKQMPKLKIKEYLKLKNEPQFRDNLAIACENCILKIVRQIEVFEKFNPDNTKIPKTTRYCDPKKTTDRFKVFQINQKTMENIQFSSQNTKRTITQTNRDYTYRTNIQKNNILTKDSSQNRLFPINDQITMPSLDFQVSNKFNKLEKIDQMLSQHPKKQFLKTQYKEHKVPKYLENLFDN